MSENIESKVYNKISKNSVAGGHHPYEAAMSIFAGKSEQTKLSKYGDVSQPVPYHETVKSVPNFSIQFDRLYAEFKGRIEEEYAKMRDSYLAEYQNNYLLNERRKEERIVEVQTEID